MTYNKKLLSHLSDGILKGNPIFRLAFGVCPALAITTSLINGLWMGIAVTLVLICSNTSISLLKSFIPERIKIYVFIILTAGFVTIIQMLFKAFLPSINASLGVYLPLIAVSCIILDRAESLAYKSSFLPSLLDAIGMGIGFTAALTLIGLVREILGSGQIVLSESLVIPVTSALGIAPMLIFILPPGGFFVFGILIALSRRITHNE